MVKIFRKIRKKLLEQGKTANTAFAKASAGTYLKYAIGENLLIVVGILIAENLAPTLKGGFSRSEL